MHTWVVIVVYTEFEWGLSFKNKFQICNIKMNLKIGNWIFHLSVLKKNRRNESHIEHKLYLNILRCTFKMQNIILRKKREIATITIHLANLIVANKNKCWIWKKMEIIIIFVWFAVLKLSFIVCLLGKLFPWRYLTKLII